MPKSELIEIPREEYESMKETLEILSNKKLMKDIKEGIEDIKKGRYITFQDFKKKHHLS
ncbi:hypothetical protein HYX07_00935 [Candidatus Woesearchaeota archaeon]|nr:hypothetical protein [Candidatus Woesearchaeota archaeon]